MLCTLRHYEHLCTNAPLFPHEELGFIISQYFVASVCMVDPKRFVESAAYWIQSSRWWSILSCFANKTPPLQQLTWSYDSLSRPLPQCCTIRAIDFQFGLERQLYWHSILTWTIPHSSEIYTPSSSMITSDKVWSSNTKSKVSSSGSTK